MSYARFMEGDVYVYASADRNSPWCSWIGGVLICEACRLTKAQPSQHGFGVFHSGFVCTQPQGMLAHLAAHEAAGHVVPARAKTRLRREAKGKV